MTQQGTPPVADRISFDLVAEIDLDDIAGIDDTDLAEHFRAIADRALTSQLKRFLDGSDEVLLAVDDESERPALTQRFVDRRVAVVREMRSARAAFADFDRSLNEILAQQSA